MPGRDGVKLSCTLLMTVGWCESVSSLGEMAWTRGTCGTVQSSSYVVGYARNGSKIAFDDGINCGGSGATPGDGITMLNVSGACSALCAGWPGASACFWVCSGCDGESERIVPSRSIEKLETSWCTFSAGVCLSLIPI